MSIPRSSRYQLLPHCATHAKDLIIVATCDGASSTGQIADLLPALKGEGSCEGGSHVPLIYSGLHLSFEGHSGGSELPTS